MEDASKTAPIVPRKGPVAAILRNAGKLLSGKAAAGVLSLVYLAIAARALGPSELGALVLAHSYALVVAGLARFQSWQAVIRFGAPMLDNAGEVQDEAGLKRLLRYTIRLDLLSAAASVIIALAAVPFVANAFGWSEDVRALIYFYCAATPFLIAATPSGALRLFDQFRTLSAQLTLMPLARCVGALILWAAGAGLGAFLVVWILSAVLHGLSLWGLGIRALAQRNLIPKLTGPASDRASREWLPFMIKTNLSSSIDLIHNNVPLLIVGAVLGPAAAGLFKIAFNLANLLAQPVNMLNQAMFPELSKTNAAQGRSQMVSVAVKSVGVALAIAAPIVIVFFIFRRDLPVLVAGEAFAAAAPLVALMAAAQLVRISALGFESAILAQGRAGWALVSQALGALTNIGVLVFFLSQIGVIAAPIAIIAGWGVLTAALIVGMLQRSND